MLCQVIEPLLADRPMGNLYIPATGRVEAHGRRRLPTIRLGRAAGVRMRELLADFYHGEQVYEEVQRRPAPQQIHQCDQSAIPSLDACAGEEPVS